MITERLNSANYKLLTFTAVNNAIGQKEFDFNLVQSRRIIIKRIAFKWYQIDNVDGLPYKNSRASIDGLLLQHDVIDGTSQKIFIPENFASNKFQNGNCLLQFTINSKPVYLNGKMDNLFLKEDNINLVINEPVTDINIKVANAKMVFLDNTGALIESDNIGWVCELGVYIV